MKTDCLDIGIIQSFLDGELVNGEMTRVSTHVAACNSCAAMLAEAEDESAIVFPALEREFDTLVPTQRLWNRINASIAIEKQQASVWEKAYAFFAAAFANPSITVVAGLLIVAGAFAMMMINRTPEPTGVAVVDPVSKPATPVSVNPNALTVDNSFSTTDDQVTPSTRRTLVPQIERAAYKADFRRPNIQSSVDRKSAVVTTADYMPGEESYVKTISNLTKTVEDQKAGGVLRPSQQVAYERDMAVVNDAITKMRAAIKRNPKNESAKQVLYSSYQNKIDLLNSVAQKEELVASLK